MIVRAILLGIGVPACAPRASSPGTEASGGVQRMTLEVGPQRVPGTGEARTRCLRIRILPDTSWMLFYDRIDGFEFEEGYRWRLEVERRRVANPPADGSSFAYRLLRVLSREREG